MRALVRQQLLLPALVIAVLILAAVLLSENYPMPWIVSNDRWMRNLIREHFFQSALLAFVIYFVTSLIPGLTGKSIIVGWLFGFTAGLIIVNCALVTAAMTAFLICRHFLKSTIESRFGCYLAPIQKRLQRDGAMYLLTLRMAHTPFSLMNYAAGAATAVSPRTFWWTTQLGLLPGNVVFVYAGTRLPTLEQLIESGPLGLIDGPMIIALTATVFIPWFVRWTVRSFGFGRPPVQQLPGKDKGH